MARFHHNLNVKLSSPQIYFHMLRMTWIMAFYKSLQKCHLFWWIDNDSISISVARPPPHNKRVASNLWNLFRRSQRRSQRWLSTLLINHFSIGCFRSINSIGILNVGFDLGRYCMALLEWSYSLKKWLWTKLSSFLKLSSSLNVSLFSTRIIPQMRRKYLMSPRSAEVWR